MSSSIQQPKLSAGRAAAWLRENGFPFSDQIPLEVTQQRFAKGGQYGVEIPVVNNMRILQTMVRLLKSEGVYATRFNETHGSFLLSDSEIQEMLCLARESGYGYTFGLGPRPEYDIKASFYRSPFGLELGRKLNNNDAIRASVEEALRLADLGCRGLIVYDIGVLRILNKMRKDGVLPQNTAFKLSSHCMVSNPMIAQMFHENGADSVTTVHDLTLPVLQEMRRMNNGLVFDVPIDVYKSKGGYIRFYELAELVQVASPIILKMGASAQGHPYDEVKESMVLERVRRVKRGLEILDQYLEVKERVNMADINACLPEPSASGGPSMRAV